MRILSLAILLAVGSTTLATKSVAADTNYAGMLAAAREVSNQISYLQELYTTDDQFLRVNGLVNQTIDFQTALSTFRQSVAERAPAEQIAINFATVDRKLNTLLDVVQGLQTEVPSVNLVCNRLRVAEHNLHFAVFAGDNTPNRNLEVLLRQTMAQNALVERLNTTAGWLFSNPGTVKVWQNDLTAVQQALADMEQVVQTSGATPAQIKAKFGDVETAWAQVTQKYEVAKPEYKVTLRSNMAAVDQGFSRLAPLAGVKDRQATVTDGYSGY
jgi:hypothetical protein